MKIILISEAFKVQPNLNIHCYIANKKDANRKIGFIEDVFFELREQEMGIDKS